MTHIKNIEHILTYGITHQESINNNPNYISIGDSNLISKRKNIFAKNKSLGSFIPFYFGTRMPMLFVIMRGANNLKYDIKPMPTEEIIYCVTTVEQVIKHKLNFLFSDGHAVTDLTRFYNSSDVNNILQIVDMKAIQSKYWNDENDLDLKRRKEAEFLLANDLPPEAISGYICYNSTAKENLINLGIPEKLIAVRPNDYF